MALIKIKQVDGLQNLSTSVTTNTSGIADLVVVDSALSTAVAANAGDISDNAGDISTNTGNISTNTSDIADLVVVDSALSTDIAANASDISTNASDIADLVVVDSALSTDIAANAASISALGHNMQEEVATYASPNNFDITTVFDVADVLVFVNGLKIDARDYTVNPGVDIVFTGFPYAVEATDEVIAYGRI